MYHCSVSATKENSGDLTKTSLPLPLCKSSLTSLMLTYVFSNDPRQDTQNTSFQTGSAIGAETGLGPRLSFKMQKLQNMKGNSI